MFRYLLIVSLIAIGCTKKAADTASAPAAPASTSELEQALKSAPSYAPACEKLKADADKVCGAGADCPLKDASAVNAAMDVIANSPVLQKVDVDLVNNFLSLKTPTKTDVAMGTAIVGRDCWSMQHVKVWRGLLLGVKSKDKAIDKSKVQKLFRERVFLMDQNLPNYLKLSLKFVLVKEAVDKGLFKMSKDGQKPLDELEGRLKAVRASLNQEYAKAFKNDAGQPADPDPEKAKYDPAVVADLMKKELALANTLSGEVNTWITKYLTD